MNDVPDDNDDNILHSAEIIDREERKALKEKARLEKEAQTTSPQEQKKAVPSKNKFADADKAKRKKIFKLTVWLVGLVLFGWLLNYLFAPFKAGMTYGICKTYLELNVQFPQDLRISTVDDLGKSVRIWYTQIDAFGEYRLENIHCYFRADELTGAAVDRITINRREVDAERIARFNTSISAILQNPPDLTIPAPLPSSLQDLQINTDAFRFQLNLQKTIFFNDK